jgi:hypothetical protein
MARLDGVVARPVTSSATLNAALAGRKRSETSETMMRGDCFGLLSPFEACGGSEALAVTPYLWPAASYVSPSIGSPW